MQHQNFQKQMSFTNKKDKIFNVRKVHYKQFDYQKYLKPTFSPFNIRQNVYNEQQYSNKLSKKGMQYHYQVGIISSQPYKQLTKKYNTIKEEHNHEKQKRLQQLQLKQEELSKCKSEKERIDAQRIKIIQRRDQLRYKIQEIREKNQMLRQQKNRRQEQYRLINMDYLKNMVLGLRYQNGVDIDPDNMTYEELLQLEEKMGTVSKGLTEEQIEKLPKTICKQKQSQQLCSVCYYNAKEHDQMTILPCNHTFHTDCIKQWLLKEKICPMCKQQIITKIQSSKKLILESKQKEASIKIKSLKQTSSRLLPRQSQSSFELNESKYAQEEAYVQNLNV